MDFKTFLPDFEAIKKTDWAKPQVDTKDKTNLLMFVGAALMVVFVFFPWIKLSAVQFGNTWEGSDLGVTEWYGVFALLCGLAAVVGALYNHTTLAFTAAVLGLFFGLLGLLCFPEVTVKCKGESDVISGASEWEDVVKASTKTSISRLGTILYLVATAVTGAVAYLKITKK